MATLTATAPRAASKFVGLGTILVDQGLLTPDRLAEALSEQKRTGRLLGRVLVENGFVTEEQLARTLATQLEVPYIDLRRYEVNFATVRVMSEMQARRFRGLVLEDREDSYLVGLVDPFDLRAQDEISALLERPIDLALITNEQLVQTVDRVYRKTEQISEFAKEVEHDIDTESDGSVVDLGALDDSVQAEDAPVVRLLQTVFDDAVQVRASDIHIEPQEKKLVVRFRIDGVLHRQLDADPKIAGAMVVRLKLLAGLDIAEKRLPQDGRMSVRSGSRRLDVRMSTMPSQHGESVVLRILMAEGELIDLERPGIPVFGTGTPPPGPPSLLPVAGTAVTTDGSGNAITIYTAGATAGKTDVITATITGGNAAIVITD